MNVSPETAGKIEAVQLGRREEKGPFGLHLTIRLGSDDSIVRYVLRDMREVQRMMDLLKVSDAHQLVGQTLQIRRFRVTAGSTAGSSE